MEVDYARRVRDAAYIYQCASSGCGTKLKHQCTNSICILKIPNYIYKKSNSFILLNGNPGLGNSGTFIRVLFVQFATIYVPKFRN